MKKTCLFVLLLFVFGNIFSQEVVVPEVKIKDHHEIYDEITIKCDYSFAPNKGVELTAVFPELKNPTSYNVASLQYPVGLDYQSGDIVDIVGKDGKGVDKYQDVFSKTILLPKEFAFCYYGVKYSEIVISDNGVVSFGSKLAQTEIGYEITGSIEGGKSNGLPLNSIFGVFHDMVNYTYKSPQETKSRVRTRTEGIAPYRKFIISYDNIPLENSTDSSLNSTSQIVLYETTNIIDVYVKNKSINPSATDKENKAIIGLTNATGSQAIVPDGRNTGIWAVKNEAWRFYPTGSSTTTIEWLDGNGISLNKNNQNPIIVYPNATSQAEYKYKVKITYNLCTPVKVEADFKIKFSIDFPTAKNVEMKQNIPCLGNGVTEAFINLKNFESEISQDTGVTFIYYKSSASAEKGENTGKLTDAEVINYAFSTNETVYVRVDKGGECYKVVTISLKVNMVPKPTSFTTSFTVCDMLNDETENVNLKKLFDSQLSSYYYKFLDENKQDITAQETNYPVTITGSGSKTFYLVVWNKTPNDPSCSTEVPFTITFNKQLELEEYIVEFCPFSQGQKVIVNLNEYREKLLKNVPVNPVYTDVTWEYYEDVGYKNKIENPNAVTITLDKIIYVKATPKAPGYCGAEKITLILMASMDCEGGGEVPKPPSGPNPILCNMKDEVTINLGKGGFLPLFFSGISIDLNKIQNIEFYEDAAHTQPLPVTGTPPVYDYTFNPPIHKVFYLKYTMAGSTISGTSSFELRASKKEKIENLIFDVCDILNDGKEYVDLKQYESLFRKAYSSSTNSIHFGDDPYDRILFFDTEENKNNYLADPTGKYNIGLITGFTLLDSESPKTVYPIVNFNGCSYDYAMEFNLVPIAVKSIGDYLVCDFRNDNKETINIFEYFTKADIEALLSVDQLSKLETPLNDITLLKYYKTLKEAHIDDSVPISDPTKVEIDNLNPQDPHMSVFIKLKIEGECPLIVEIKFDFTTAVDIPDIKDIYECDRDTAIPIDLNRAITSLPANTDISFYTSEAAAENGSTSSPDYITSPNNYQVPPHSGDITIYIRIQNGANKCIKVESFLIKLVPPLNIKQDIEICSNENNLTIQQIRERIITQNLPLLTNQFKYSFYENEADALANVNELLESKQLTIIASTELWIKIDTKEGNCKNVFKINFILIPPPVLIKEQIEDTICNNIPNNVNGKPYEIKKLSDYNNQLLIINQENYNFYYYKTEKEALAGGGGKLPDQVTITEFPTKYWARVEDKTTGCASIAQIIINSYDLEEDKVENYDVRLCKEGKPEKTGVDIEVETLAMFVNELDKNNFDRIYYYKQTDAIKGNGNFIDISASTIIEVSEGSEIWVRFVNKKTGCFMVRRIMFTIHGLPKGKARNVYVCDECDGEMDDRFTIPDLSFYNETYVEGEPGYDALYTFHHYKTEADAEADDQGKMINELTFTGNQLTSLPNGQGQYSIFVRITRKDGSACSKILQVNFIVDAKVPVTGITLPVLCDGDDLDGKSRFDLTSVESQVTTITGSQYKYYLSEADARKDENEISTLPSNNDVTSYENRILTNEGLLYVDEVYVRLSNQEKGYCDNIAKLILKVYPYIKVKNEEQIICEYDPEGGKTKVDLWSSVRSMLSQNGDDAKIDEFLKDMRIIFEYSGSEIGRVENTLGTIPAILTNYEPPAGQATVAVIVKFENKENGCGNQGTINIVQKETPLPNKVTYIVCDEDLNGVYDDVLLNDLDKLVITTPQLYEISYYNSREEALGVINGIPIDKETFFKIDFTHSLYVRVKDKTTQCIGINEIVFQKNENHVPIVKEISLETQCDGEENDSKGVFNLHEAEQIIASVLPSGTYKYYRSEAEAKDAFKDEVVGIFTHIQEPEISNYINRDLYKEGLYTVDEVFVRVKDAEGNFCDDIAKVKLYIYPYIPAKDYRGVQVCEFESDGKAESKVNLMEEVKHMTGDINTALLDDIDITFYESQLDAEGLTGGIPVINVPAYAVSVGVTEVWVRFQSKTTQCYQVRKMTITKTEAPKIKALVELLCDDNLDNKFDIILGNLDSKIPLISGNYEISYYETIAEAELGGVGIPKYVNYEILESEFEKLIAVRVIDKNTGCVRTGTIKIVTNPKVELINEEVELYACDGDNDGYAEFELTLVADEISIESNISFTYFASLEDAQKNKNPITNFTSYVNKKSELDYVYVRVEENEEDLSIRQRCPSLARIKLITYHPPAPPRQLEYICPRTAITLEAIDSEAKEEEYEMIRWFFNGVQVGKGRFLEDVEERGIYTVELTKMLNYGIPCTATFEIEVRLLEDPVILDLEQGKDYITVLAKGPEPLEYSIDNKNWQRSNTFTNLESGIYTFYVRSTANGCEAITSQGIIFGVPNAITPNGDGYNDVWRLCGLHLFSEPSHIKIFDRYGKEVFTENSSTCFVWDGKHLGRNLPTSSYWYIITIADGRKYTGWILLRNYDESHK